MSAFECPRCAGPVPGGEDTDGYVENESYSCKKCGNWFKFMIVDTQDINPKDPNEGIPRMGGMQEIN